MDRARSLIIFDGQCNLCNGVVGWMLRRDGGDRYKFIPFRSADGQAMLKERGFPLDRLDSVIVIDRSLVYTKSDGFLKMMEELQGWNLLARSVKVIPRSLRDAVYVFASRNRVRLFGQASACVIPN